MSWWLQVLVVRQDLRMGAGKIASQCARKTIIWLVFWSVPQLFSVIYLCDAIRLLFLWSIFTICRVHFFHPVLNCKSVEINVADYFWLWFVNLQVVLTSIFLWSFPFSQFMYLLLFWNGRCSHRHVCRATAKVLLRSAYFIRCIFLWISFFCLL